MPHHTNIEKSVVLPPDFLNTPAPDLKVSRVDFNEAGLPRYRGLYAVVLDGVLSPAECRMMIEAAEATTSSGWDRAMVNVGGGRQMLMSDSRNCGRIIWDSQELIDKVWKRIEHLPEVAEILRLHNVPKIFGNGPLRRDEVWKFARPNERLRFLKYVGGEYFRPHCDGTYETPDKQERSYFTLHLYLNGDEEAYATGLEKKQGKGERLIGGATTFHAPNMQDSFDVMPRCGRILLFQHRDLLHSGDDVVRGTKYTMRTDLMYALESQAEVKNTDRFTQGVEKTTWSEFL